ncbi:MAG: hypothetical protein AMJ54_16310 [Deltaproteobacteria bacterium SG8_13]|nr:MAG: hypothetical protein AMJ54_16310 [Deltaproteobacteria bacterium SG8_13]
MLADKLIKLLQLAVGLLVAAPVAWVLPKNKSLVLFIGNGDGQFRDNVKYLYLHFVRKSPPGIAPYFLTENRSVLIQLQQQGLPVLFYPRSITFWKMLRASVVVADNFAWIKKAKYHILLRSFKVQLWHGCSIKRLELDDPLLKPSPASLVGKILYFTAGRFPTYDLLLSTSEANTRNIFRHAFRYRKIIESGYPRNDVFFRKPDPLDLLGTDTAVFEQVRKFKNQGRKIVLYAPTYRDTGDGDDFLEQSALDLEALNRFGEQQQIIFVFKVHPNRRFDVDFDHTPALLRYHSTADVYPFLPLVDLLLTDYSSIFFDYLHLDRPIVFFPYDYEKYTREDRKLTYDYNWVTPGPKCVSQSEMQQAIATCLEEKPSDAYREKRKEIFEMAFYRRREDSAENITRAIISARGL